jgi:peptidyl-prolyl cis-trans isomerase-like 3
MSLTLHTTHGDMKVELFVDSTPKTSENFLAFAASGYYDNCKIHRIVPSFLVQTGDPTGTGKGGKECVWGGHLQDEMLPTLKHNARGILSMANSNKPNTNGSQFFFTLGKQPTLDGKFTVFGKVIDGMDVLDTIEKVPIDAKNRPTELVAINSITIHANPLAQ